MNISIFADLWKYRRTVTRRYPHIIRGSSMIRGEQIADYLGCKFNPESGYDQDLCIYVKPITLDHVKDGDWVDIVDGDHIISWLKERPGINVIVNGETSYNLYRPQIENKMAVIPPHHCNFGRELRDRRRAVKTVGYIGSPDAFGYPLDEMKRRVEDLGLNFIYNITYKNRQDVVDFYKQIDVQAVWAHRRFRMQSRGPTKFINAASFEIPTVGYPQVCCDEIEGKYIKAHTLEDMLAELLRLKHDPAYYKFWTSPEMTYWAEEYHISSIAELYKQL